MSKDRDQENNTQQVGKRRLGRGKSSKRRQLVDAEIYSVAIKLFSEKGYKGTSLQDIADELELSRPALYHYVKSKEEILARLVEEFTEANAEDQAQLVSKSNLSPTDKLVGIVTITARSIAQRPLHFRLLDRCENELPSKMKERNTAGKRAVRDAFIKVLTEGCDEGVFHCSDIKKTAFALIGMCTWIAWWFQPGSEAEQEEIVELFVGLALRAVSTPQTTSSFNDQDPKRVILNIREKLDILEKSISR